MSELILYGMQFLISVGSRTKVRDIISILLYISWWWCHC